MQRRRQLSNKSVMDFFILSVLFEVALVELQRSKQWHTLCE